jgi:UDP-N-acetylmuramate--alanine ligase
VLGRTRRIHFVGIGGSGMNGIAELLANLGFVVTGSDLAASDVTERLARHGIRVDPGHDARHVGDADVVVVSSAIRPTNPEIVEAGRRRIPVIPRAEMLAELMRLKYGIAVAGAHGKTTTTSMIALILDRAGLDPTAVIGGRLNAFGGHARLGHGEYMVVEADESDRSFLTLAPVLAVITNIDHEHLENYASFEHLQQAFVDFANKVPFYGAVIACTDGEPVQAILPKVRRRVVTCGLEDPDAAIGATAVRSTGGGSACTVVRREGGAGANGTLVLGELALGVPGRHNLQDALAAVAAATELGVTFDDAAAALAVFRGAERRFQRRGQARGIEVVDDYGHHPTEIAAVVAAARAAYPGRRLLVVFQPHRYTRTARLMDRFGPALAGAAEVILTGIYGAGEDAIPGATVEALAGAIDRDRPHPVHLVPDLDQVPPAVARLARPGDVVITLGAGSIGGAGDRILALLERAGPLDAGSTE